MRMTIIPSDDVVSIDGVTKSPLDLSFMDPAIHAVQWYETWGEIEYFDPATGRMTENVGIKDVAQFQPAIDAWNNWVDPNAIAVTQL